MTFQVVFEGDDATGWSAFVPDLPGIAVTGATIDEARALVPKAIQWHLVGMREDGVPIPRASHIVVEAVTVAAP